MAAAARPTDGDELWSYDEGDEVDSWDSPGGGFRVHFTRSGAHSVLRRDRDGDGVPDPVQQVGAIYDEVADFYEAELGFRRPPSDADLPGDNGGDGRFDVYLADFAGASDGAFRVDRCERDHPGRCVGFVVQENDFSGYAYSGFEEATRILGSHEYFHAVQAAYDASLDATLSEGTAVWASEVWDPELDDFEGFVGGYLSRTDRSLDVPPPGPVQAFTYGAALFFRFLEERFSRELIRDLFEAIDAAPDEGWLQLLDGLLAEGHGSSFAAAFVELATWNLYTGAAADATRAWAEGGAYPRVATVEVEAPLLDDGLRLFHASATYLELAPGVRPAVAAELLAADPAALEGLALVLAAERRDRVATLSEPGLSAVLDASGAERVLVVLVNGGVEGRSKQPVLCLGSPDEVEECRAVALPEEAADAGPEAGDAAPEVGPPGLDAADAALADVPEPQEDAGTGPVTGRSGCACRYAPGPTVLRPTRR